MSTMNTPSPVAYQMKFLPKGRKIMKIHITKMFTERKKLLKNENRTYLLVKIKHLNSYLNFCHNWFNEGNVNNFTVYDLRHNNDY